VVTLVVARRLTPDEYGVASLAAAFAVASGYVTEYGIGRAVVMQRITRKATLGRLHAVSIATGLVLALLLCALAPVIARFWHEPRVTAPLLVWSLTFAFNGFMAVPSGRIQRRLAYRTIGTIELGRGLAQGMVVLGVALAGGGYWALVAGYLTASLLSALAYCGLAWVRPMWPARHEMRALLAYPLHIVTGNMSWYGYSNADYLVAGRLLGLQALGQYQFAWNIAQLPGDKLLNVLQGVTGPLFGSLGSTPGRVRSLLEQVVELAALVIFPVVAGIGTVAPLVIPLLFGAKWLPAVAPMQLLLVNGALMTVSVLVTQALNASGRARETGRLGLLLLLLMPPSFAVGARLAGIAGVATAWLVAQPLILGVPLREARAAFGLRVRDVEHAIRPAVCGVGVMVASVLAVRAVLPGPPAWGALAIEVAVGAVVYVVTLATLFPRRLRATVHRWRDVRSA
jgi:PST family polysaccharide transporter